MKWENLKSNHCPFCGEYIVRDELGLNMKCTYCRFVIEIERFNLIALHRGKPEQDHKKMKWQNLHDNKCPLCDQELMEELSRYEIVRCVNLTCDFRIRQDNLNRILQDPNHSANIFHKK